MLSVIIPHNEVYDKETLVAYQRDNNIIRYRTIDGREGRIKYKSAEFAKDLFVQMLKQEAKEIRAGSDKVLYFELF